MKLTELLANGNAVEKDKNIRIVTEINELVVDIPIEGTLNCYNNQLTSLVINQPIGGGLNCSYNQLTSLVINQPIGGWLDCSYNQLTSLVINHPIGGGLDCSYNQLTSLVINHPIGGWLDCSYNQLTSLVINHPIGGGLYCYNNQLTSLVINQPIGGALNCYNNQLTSLVINQPIGGWLDCSYNQLTSLVINQPIGGWLDCSYNQLTSLVINQPIGGGLDCSHNNLKQTPFYDRLKNGDVGDNWVYFDEILTHYTKKRTIKGVTFYIGFRYTVAVQREHAAHGKDMRSALIDLRFKQANRDSSDYEGLTLESVLPYEDAIVMYRVITGACQAGTEMFLDQHNIAKRNYTIAEILEKTQGQYGSYMFQKFFEKGE